jgi:hypothetical protein
LVHSIELQKLKLFLIALTGNVIASRGISESFNHSHKENDTMAVARTNATQIDSTDDDTTNTTGQTTAGANPVNATSTTDGAGTAANTTSNATAANTDTHDTTTHDAMSGSVAGADPSSGSAVAGTDGGTEAGPASPSASGTNTETGASPGGDNSADAGVTGESAAGTVNSPAGTSNHTNGEAGANASNGEVNANDQASASANDHAPVGDAQSPQAGAQGGEHVFVADLDALNNSGVDGFALINTKADGSVTVNVVAEGLEANQEHAQQIHGFADGKDSVGPTIAQDADGDGFVESSEGESAYGQSLFDLTSKSGGSSADGSTSGNDHDAGEGSSSADNSAPGDHASSSDAAASGASDGQAAGTTAAMADSTEHASASVGENPFSETHTFTGQEATALLDKLGQFDGNEFVLFGQSVDAKAGAGTEGEVDGTAGFKDELPVASGEIHELSGLSAKVALDLLDNAGDDPSAAQLSSTFHTAEALQALVETAFGNGSTTPAAGETANGTGAAGGQDFASDSATPAGSQTTGDHASSSTMDGGSQTAANDDMSSLTSNDHHQGDMMFA